MDESVAPCRLLEWDTEFFGRRIARANVQTLTGARLAEIDAWSADHTIDCLYFLAQANDPETVRLAETGGFRLVEIRLTFERKLQDWPYTRLPGAPQGLAIRPSLPDDLPALQAIAANSYVDSRFYFDPHFRQEHWQTYYSYWVKKSILGGAPLALTAELDGEIVGYITGQVDRENNEGIYELTGVRHDARRAGVGQELFRCGVEWYVRQGVPSMWVATQGRNIPTQRMIQRFGFLTRACELYYHKWYHE